MTGAFLLCATLVEDGLLWGGGAYLYSRRLTPCGRGLRQPPGLTALGCQGSVRDRLTPPGRVEGSALGRYEVSLRWRGGRPHGRHFLCRLWRRKPSQPGLRPWENHTTALRASEMHPFWWLAPPPSPRRGDFILRYALALFCPACGGSPAQPDRGASAASQSAECFSCHMTQ